jgi:hypothetical protein
VGEPDSTPSGEADGNGWVVGLTAGRVADIDGLSLGEVANSDDGAGRVVGPTDGWFNAGALDFGVGSTVGIVVVGSNGDETTGGNDANPFVGPGDGWITVDVVGFGVGLTVGMDDGIEEFWVVGSIEIFVLVGVGGGNDILDGTDDWLTEGFIETACVGTVDGDILMPWVGASEDDGPLEGPWDGW